MRKTEHIYNNTSPPRKSPFLARTSSFRRLLQYQQLCSYCGILGHNQANCLLRDVDSIDIYDIKSSSENIETRSSLLTEFIPTKYSYENINMRTQLLTELIPKKYWVQNCDPVKLFLNNNNIHNYRTQQQWKKKKYN